MSHTSTATRFSYAASDVAGFTSAVCAKGENGPPSWLSIAGSRTGTVPPRGT